MSSLTVARALGAALVLVAALPAHAGTAAGLRDARNAAASPAAFATGLAQRPEEALLFVLPVAGDGRSALDEGQRGQRSLPRFETESAPRPAAFGLIEGSGDALEGLARRASRRAGFALALPLGAFWTASAGSLRPRTDWAQGPILRGETSVILPLSDRVAFKTTLVDHYDASPDADANTFQTLVGISLLF